MPGGVHAKSRLIPETHVNGQPESDTGLPGPDMAACALMLCPGCAPEPLSVIRQQMCDAFCQSMCDTWSGNGSSGPRPLAFDATHRLSGCAADHRGAAVGGWSSGPVNCQPQTPSLEGRMAKFMLIKITSTW
jgi:hypothetical protein